MTIPLESTDQHKMIHDLQKQQVIIVALNTATQHTELSFYDDKNLLAIMGSFVYFENATFMTDVYFSSTHTLVIKDITGDKRLVNTNDYSITFIAGNPFPEIYIKPYWYSQPTNDTLFVHDKHGSKYLFDLGHSI